MPKPLTEYEQALWQALEARLDEVLAASLTSQAEGGVLVDHALFARLGGRLRPETAAVVAAWQAAMVADPEDHDA